MEFRLSQRFVADHDFAEGRKIHYFINAVTKTLISRVNELTGVRALLIDKDQKPQWMPQRLEDCTEEKVLSYFEPPNHPDLDLSRSSKL